ncbi:unnamed protein product [Nezara viridula]|uniref:Uncharacterized protein n=1 Tax=Nezara viridula TaxID=85310 RepID=A0A9P0E7W6_NEZVI|nr:unnamed protein product [Nezara viridula]CAH1393892.1 unnamed protein product [Nezara viridula]CAH1393893.1 unnamed protein product [Nezara viridula]
MHNAVLSLRNHTSTEKASNPLRGRNHGNFINRTFYIKGIKQRRTVLRLLIYINA